MLKFFDTPTTSPDAEHNILIFSDLTMPLTSLIKLWKSIDKVCAMHLLFQRKWKHRYMSCPLVQCITRTMHIIDRSHVEWFCNMKNTWLFCTEATTHLWISIPTGDQLINTSTALKNPALLNIKPWPTYNASHELVNHWTQPSQVW